MLYGLCEIDAKGREWVPTVHISDLHDGSREHTPNMRKKLINTLDWAKFHEAKIFLYGDLLNSSTDSSPGNLLSEVKHGQEQLDELVDVFTPYKELIVQVLQGNHERQIWKKSGYDPTKLFAERLGVKDAKGKLMYSNGQSLIQVTFAHTSPSYVFFGTHGTGGGKKDGSALNNLKDLVLLADADFYGMGHTHKLFVAPPSQHIVVDQRHRRTQLVKRHYMNTGAYLEYNESYAEEKNLSRAAVGSGVVWCNTNPSKRELIPIAGLVELGDVSRLSA